MNTKARLRRLEVARKGAPVFFWQDGDDLTAEQKADVAAAEAEGREVMIFGWGPRPVLN